MKASITVGVIVACAWCNTSKAQEWWFWPKYALGQKASNYAGNRLDAPQSQFKPVDHDGVPLIFHGEEPSDRRRNFTSSSALPSGAFSVELWIVNHVNQPVGALVTVKDKHSQHEPEWLLGFYDHEAIFSLRTSENPFANLLTIKLDRPGWKSYWTHLVATYTGKEMSLFVNGALAASLPVGERVVFDPEHKEIEIAAYAAKEPYMELGNLVKMLRISDETLTEKVISSRFEVLKRMVEEGKLFPDTFHFNAGPYLNYATTEGISILWETDRPSSFIVEYGERLPLDKTVNVNQGTIELEAGAAVPGNISEVTLRNLQPGVPYFYNIKAMATDGSEMESGVLTFSTAVDSTEAFAFAVMGDTEARPHINDRLSKLIWDERPNFVLNVGDLTDGGKVDHKYEWNFEYFQGVTQLTSRIPVYPVAGNGESDLLWYKKYHVLPDPEGFYRFTYGNAEFFMLDSNRPEEFSPGGKQYRWLEERLTASKAMWKFVAMHHAPYSADEDDYGDAWQGTSTMGDVRIRAMVPLFEKYTVDMVFFGHLHTYQRTLPVSANRVDRRGGVIYVQGGGGGGNLEDFAPSRAWFSAKTYRGHHYFIVTIAESELNFKMYDIEGRLKDYLDVIK